jgi:hypothetical protein
MLPEEARILRHEQNAAALVQAAEGKNHFVRRSRGIDPKRHRDGQQKQRENIASKKAVFHDSSVVDWTFLYSFHGENCKTKASRY